MGNSTSSVTNFMRCPGENWDPNNSSPNPEFDYPNRAYTVVDTIGQTGHTMINSRFYGGDENPDTSASTIYSNMQHSLMLAISLDRADGGIILDHNGRPNVSVAIAGTGSARLYDLFMLNGQSTNNPMPFYIRPLPSGMGPVFNDTNEYYTR